MDLLAFNGQMNFILDKISGVDGDIVELGVHTGNNSIQFMLQSPQTKYWGFDTFCGYTKEDIESSPNKQGLLDNEGRWVCDENETIDRIKRFRGLIKEITPSDKKFANFEIIKGDLKKTLPEQINSNNLKKVALLYVDCNAYLPAIKGIEAIYPILSREGIICIDEHQDGGETKAIKETAQKYGLNINETGFKFESGIHSNPSKYIVKK